MNSITDMYSVVTKAQSYGVEGYYVENKYVDPRKMKQEKILETSKDKSVTSKAKDSSKKTTYIDEVLKRSANFPGPSTYEPKQIETKQMPNSKRDSPPRKTIFDEIQKIQQKFNFPAAGIYDKIQVEPDKTKKVRSNLSKAQVNSYLDQSMRKSIECPGVGEYNSRIDLFQHKNGVKWPARDKKKDKKSVSERHITMKLPDVGTYNPHPLAFQLFETIAVSGRGKSKSHFNRQQRFKSSKEKPIPYYNIGSEWGMKSKLQKKDILSRVGSSVTHHSVYY